MKALVTACTNRKRQLPEKRLTARTLSAGSLREVSRAWRGRLESGNPLAEARDYYCGRGFQEALAASKSLDGDLFVVSAGLGLLTGESRIPAYSLTVSAGHPDCVMTHLPDSVSRAQWWAEVARESPFSSRLGHTSVDLLVVALPGPYLEIFLPYLERQTGGETRPIRIVCRPEQQGIPTSLKSAVIPYDDRLDGDGSPIQGTMADFASRAGRHFVERVLQQRPKASAAAHRQIAEGLLSSYRAKEKVARPKLSDAEICRLIQKHWHDVEGRSGRMLRFLRDHLQVACEQGRFKDLFRTVAETQGAKH